MIPHMPVQADNTADMVTKGRQAAGDKNGSRQHPECLSRGHRHGRHTHPEMTARGARCRSTKLTETDVRLIRKGHSDGTPQTVLAEKFGVTPTAINNVVLGYTWEHITC